MENNKQIEAKGDDYLTRTKYKELLKQKKSKAKRIRLLFKKQRKIFKTIEKTTDFKEPILIFMRTNNRAEWYEDATAGLFEYQPTDPNKKDKQTIILNPAKQIIFDYGDKTFRGYIHREGDAFSYPHTPLMDAEAYNISQQKTLNDIMKHDISKLRAMGKRTEGYGRMILWVLLGIAAIIAVFGVWGLLAPTTTPWYQDPSVATAQIQAGVELAKANITKGITVLG